MNAKEFDQWYALHTGHFSAVAAWISRYPILDPKRDGEPTQRAILDAWREILGDVRLEYARQATALLAKGDEAFSERAGFDHHPRDVRRIARRLARQAERMKHVIDGELTSRCRECLNNGYCLVIHPKSVQAYRDGKLACRCHAFGENAAVPVYRAIAACRCEAGDRLRKQGHDPGWAIQTFDDAKHVEWPVLPAGECYCTTIAAHCAAAPSAIEFKPDDWN